MSDTHSDTNSIQKFLTFDYDENLECRDSYGDMMNELEGQDFDDSYDDEAGREAGDQMDLPARVTVNGKSIETTSTYESRGTTQGSVITSKAIRKKKYQPLTDEGRTYLYEDDPKKYMQVRKYVLRDAGRSRTARVRGECG